VPRSTRPCRVTSSAKRCTSGCSNGRTRPHPPELAWIGRTTRFQLAGRARLRP
jgi:hypothetical protein